jgi:hypothetical protein
MQLLHQTEQHWDIVNTLVLHYEVVWYHTPVLWNWFYLANLSAKDEYGWGTDGNGDRVLTVQVLIADAVIGSATFTYCGRLPYCENVGVESAFRRQGVANAIYGAVPK